VSASPSRYEITSPQLITKQAAAALLGISPWTVMRLVADGELPVVRIGRCVRFVRGDVADFVQSRRQVA
jgi:excisionase family DNA binding protein